jgi:NTP pyrophosphatase (non-canonical NTP hydrolase)
MKPEWKALLAEIIEFRDARDWKQFHTHKNLSAAIAIEAAELQEQFLWKTDDEVVVALADPDKRNKVIEEIADIIIFTLLLAERLDIDIDTVVRRKIKKNVDKYPVEKSKGTAKKYTEL